MSSKELGLVTVRRWPVSGSCTQRVPLPRFSDTISTGCGVSSRYRVTASTGTCACLAVVWFRTRSHCARIITSVCAYHTGS